MTSRQRLIELAASNILTSASPDMIDAIIEGTVHKHGMSDLWYGKSERAKEMLVGAIKKRVAEIRRWKK